MACGVLLLHKVNYGHNDIKPANFLLNSDGTARLCDYGSALAIGSRFDITYIGVSMQYCLDEPKIAGPRLFIDKHVVNNYRFDLTCFASSLLHLLLGRTPASLEELRNIKRDPSFASMTDNWIVKTIELCMIAHSFREVSTT